MNFRILGAALAAGLLTLAGSVPARSQPSPRAQAKARPILALPTVEQFTLDNGLRVAFLRHDAAPVVAVEIWYRAGSKDEPRTRRGSAHMFEHMMFKGTRRVRPEEHARFVAAVGGTYNAHTSEDATAYQQVVPVEYLDFVLELEAERMRQLLFRNDMIATEREVVKEEIRQQENAPTAKGFLRFLATAFTTHPYAWTAGGTIADIDATTADDLKAFYDAYYQPGNALLVVVGATTLDEIKAIAEKRFGKIVTAGPSPRPADSSREPDQTAPRREIAEPGNIGIILAGWKIPEAKAPDIYALQLLSIVLGGGESARLQQRIKAIAPKAKAPLGIDAGAPILVREHPGLFLEFAAHLDPAAGDAVEAALLDEVAKISTKPPSADELRKAKNIIQSSFVFGLDNPLGIAEQIGQSWILTGDPGQWLRDLDALENVTAADLARVARTYLTPEKSTIVVIPVKKPPTAVAPVKGAP